MRVAALLCFAISTSALSQVPPPSPAKDGKPQQTHATSADAKASASQPPTRPAPIASAPAKAEGAKPSAGTEPAKTEEKPPENRWFEIVLAGINAFAALAVAAFTGKLWTSTEGLWKETRLASKIASRSSKAAARSADAAVKTAMPVLYPRISQHGTLHPLVAATGQDVSHTAKLLIGFDNFGATPGIIRKVRAELIQLPQDVVPVVDQAALKEWGYEVMIPGGSRAEVQTFGLLHFVQPIGFSAEEFRQLLAEASGKWRRMAMAGEVIYDDFFGQRHTSRFCVKLRFWMEGDPPKPSFFQVTIGGSAYNGVTGEPIPKRDPLAKATA